MYVVTMPVCYQDDDRPPGPARGLASHGGLLLQDLSDFRTQAVLLMMLFSVAGILWPPLRAVLTEPSGILATLAVGLAASRLLRRHARRLDDKVTRALRPLVHQYVLHEVSLLLQLLVLAGAMVLSVTSLSAVLDLALSAMARAAFFAFGRLRWLVTFWFHGREAADAHGQSGGREGGREVQYAPLMVPLASLSLTQVPSHVLVCAASVVWPCGHPSGLEDAGRGAQVAAQPGR